MKKNFTLCFFLIFTFYCQSQVVINEMSTSNVSNQLDPNYDYSGWIELYNTSDEDINIKDLYFSDEKDENRKFKLTSVRTLPSKGYQIVWLNGELNNPQTNCDPDIDNNDGGYLSVSNSSGDILDSIYYTPQYVNISYGNKIDGDSSSTRVYFKHSTFKTTNNSTPTATTPAPLPIFSKATGFYDNSITVEINCDSTNTEIRYTLDSTDPTETSSLYSGPITIDTNTVLRSRAYRSDLLLGQISSATYLINERIPDLPVCFLVVDSNYLYNDSIGIYCVGTNGKSGVGGIIANYNQEWTRHANFSYLDSSKNLKLNQPIGIEISGNQSRTSDKKSFNIKAKSKYGKSGFNYSFFSKKEGYYYKELKLRNGGQKWIQAPLLHDLVIQRMLNITGLTYQAGTPTVVFLNNEYWGIYNIREPHNNAMVETKFGWDKDKIDRFKHSWKLILSKGNYDFWDTTENFINTEDLTTKENYEKIQQYIDLDDFLSYMAMEYYIENIDWGERNQEFFRRQKDNYRWRWSVCDLDYGLKEKMSLNLLKMHMEDSDNSLAIKLLPKLLVNDSIKEQYITKMCIMAGSIFNKNRFYNILNTAKEKIENEYPYDATKWNTSSSLEKKVNEIITNNEVAHDSSYINLKELFNLGNIINLNIKAEEGQEFLPLAFNDKPTYTLPYQGKWFIGKKLKLKTPLYYENKKFQHWNVIVNNDTTTVNELELTLNLVQATTIMPIYKKETLARRSGLYINEISPDNDTYRDNSKNKEDWFEIYNSSSTSKNLSGMYLSIDKDELDAFKISPDTDIIIEPHEYYIIWCDKEEDRGVNHTNFKLKKSGKTIYLSQENPLTKDIEILDQVTYPETDEDHSYGRYPDGSEHLVTFNNITFKSTNISSILDIPGETETYELISSINSPKKATADNEINIIISGSLLNIQSKTPAIITIRNIKGQEIQTIEIPKGSSLTDINNILQGCYIITVKNKTKSKSIKFIKI